MRCLSNSWLKRISVHRAIEVLTTNLQSSDVPNVSRVLKIRTFRIWLFASFFLCVKILRFLSQMNREKKIITCSDFPPFSSYFLLHFMDRKVFVCQSFMPGESNLFRISSTHETFEHRIFFVCESNMPSKSNLFLGTHS